MDFRNRVNTLIELLIVKLDKPHKNNAELKAKQKKPSKPKMANQCASFSFF